MRVLRLAALLFAFALPASAEVAIQQVTSAKGFTAWLVEDHGIPFTALEIRFQGGTSLDAPQKRGAVNLMTALIEEGAGNLDSQGFAEARDALAASFRFTAGQDSVAVSAKILTENRDQAVALLREALVNPRFDVEAVERVRGQVLSNLRANAKDPQTIAGETFDRLAFGSHPYGSTGDGTEASVQALTRDDMLVAHKAALARDRIYVAAVGDISAAELSVVMDRLLGDLPETGAPLPGRADYALAGGLTVVDFPTPQAVVLFGHQGLKRDDPDFFAAYLLNEILGGDRFSSRLMTELREKRGLTYGVGTYLATMDQAELMMGQFATANATAAQAVEILRAEWTKAATGVTAEELEAAKTYLTGSYPLRFDGNANIASILVGMQMERLPIDYSATRNDRINAVTLDDITRVAKRLVQPEALHVVVVGQPEGLASDPQE
jgi:zinc protease